MPELVRGFLRTSEDSGHGGGTFPIPEKRLTRWARSTEAIDFGGLFVQHCFGYTIDDLFHPISVRVPIVSGKIGKT